MTSNFLRPWPRLVAAKHLATPTHHATAGAAPSNTMNDPVAVSARRVRLGVIAVLSGGDL